MRYGRMPLRYHPLAHKPQVANEENGLHKTAHRPIKPDMNRSFFMNIAPTEAAFLCLVLALGILIPTAHASERVIKKRGADGVVVFSDAPVNPQGQRVAYTTSFGRKPATASCNGQTPDSLKIRRLALMPHFQQASLSTGLSVELLTAVARVESCFDPQARSSAGAIGVMQLMPPTAAELGVGNSFDARSNIAGGADYLAKMMKRHNNNLELALASYNAGPGAVAKHGGIPPYPETISYVAKVTKQLAQNQSNQGSSSRL